MNTIKIKLPTCDNPDCACGGSVMQLNGLRFVCDYHCSLEGHIDHFTTRERADVTIIEDTKP